MDGTKRTARLDALRSKEYREAYVERFVPLSLALQIKDLREERDWSQGELAQRASMQQAAISRLEKSDYRSYTISTLTRLASAFDVALVVRFVPFSTLFEWVDQFTPGEFSAVEYAQDESVHPAPRLWTDAEEKDMLRTLAERSVPLALDVQPTFLPPSDNTSDRKILAFTAGQPTKKPVISERDETNPMRSGVR